MTDEQGPDAYGKMMAALRELSPHNWGYYAGLIEAAYAGERTRADAAEAQAKQEAVAATRAALAQPGDLLSWQARFERLADIYNYERAEHAHKIQEIHHRADAAEAQRDRLVAALRQMYAEYEGDDDDWDEGWRDPDNVDDGTVTVAMPFVVLAQARAALADVPDALARQVEEG